METLFSWDTAPESVIRLLQITDPHLFSDENAELLGINTLASFKQVLKEIKNQGFAYDFILATGDLVQDGSEQGYLQFCRLIKQLEKTCFWIPGNHDLQPKMLKLLNQTQGNIHPAKHILLGNKWQIILLDSQVFGVAHGELSKYQLDWLQNILQQNANKYTLIVLHHHLLSTNSAWLDQHNLRNSQHFADVLAPFNNIKGILHGHIHQQVDNYWQGYPIMATPSTCIQFKPDCNQFTLDRLQPGWRELELHPDGRITSQVHRIKQVEFLPNMQEEGY